MTLHDLLFDLARDQAAAELGLDVDDEREATAPAREPAPLRLAGRTWQLHRGERYQPLTDAEILSGVAIGSWQVAPAQPRSSLHLGSGAASDLRLSAPLPEAGLILMAELLPDVGPRGQEIRVSLSLRATTVEAEAPVTVLVQLRDENGPLMPEASLRLKGMVQHLLPAPAPDHRIFLRVTAFSNQAELGTRDLFLCTG